MRDRVKMRPVWVRRTALGCLVTMTAYLRGAVPAVAGEATPPAGDSGSAPAERAAPKRPATKPRGDLLPARLAPVGVASGAKGSETEWAWALFDSDASTRFAPRAATR